MSSLEGSQLDPTPSFPPAPAAARKGLKRPRPGHESPSADDLPDLAAFQASHELTDVEMIKLCTSFATYLKAVHRRQR